MILYKNKLFRKKTAILHKNKLNHIYISTSFQGAAPPEGTPRDLAMVSEPPREHPRGGEGGHAERGEWQPRADTRASDVGRTQERGWEEPQGGRNEEGRGETQGPKWEEEKERLKKEEESEKGGGSNGEALDFMSTRGDVLICFY